METVRTERGAMYAMLRALFDYPLTSSVLEAVRSLDLGEDSLLAPYVAAMQSGIPHDITDEIVEDLNIEMTRLLEGPGQPAAPPFASYYVHGSLMGPVVMQVAETSRIWGVEAASGSQTLPDHVALLFGFLSFLADESPTADVGGSSPIAASREFVRRHLLPWLPDFTNSLRDSARDPFFAGLAGFTLAVVRADYEWLTLVIDVAEEGETDRQDNEHTRTDRDEVPK